MNLQQIDQLNWQWQTAGRMSIEAAKSHASTVATERPTSNVREVNLTLNPKAGNYRTNKSLVCCWEASQVAQIAAAVAATVHYEISNYYQSTSTVHGKVLQNLIVRCMAMQHASHHRRQLSLHRGIKADDKMCRAQVGGACFQVRALMKSDLPKNARQQSISVYRQL